MGRIPSGQSRRQFILTAAGAGGAMMFGAQHAGAAVNDPRVAEIAASTIVVDMHNHVQIDFAKTASDALSPILDLADAMKQAGFSVVCQTFSLDNVQNLEVGDYYKHFQQALDFEDQLLEQNKMRRALTMKDLETAHAARQPIMIQSIEGAQFMDGKLDRIEESYKRGLRHLQLLHEKDDMVKPLGDVITAPVHLGGLTQFGGEAVKECNRLGILVDMAHGTTTTVLGALKAASEPMVLSHTNLLKDSDPEMAKRYSISKDCARAVTGAGGLIGIWRGSSDTLADYVASVKAMVDVVGIDHVGIGTDTSLVRHTNQMPYTNRIWTDQNGGFFYAVAGEMLKQGFTSEEIGKYGGGNFCRVFAKVTSASVRQSLVVEAQPKHSLA